MHLNEWLKLLFENTPRSGRFTQLNAGMILQTIERLEQRVNDRFPDSGLLKVCREFLSLARYAESLALRLGPPIWPVRVFAMLGGLLLIGLSVYAIAQVVQRFSFDGTGMPDILQATESAINELIFLGLAVFFLTGLETRLKRRSALRALHQLRSIIHVVDMHQLTKDPAAVLGNMPTLTPSSPQRTLTRAELTRYLDYCSELLALCAKVAALFAQTMEDPVVLNAVNDVESLAQGLSSKIWQKIMILDLAEQG
jgi:hypothetical protein